MRGIDERTALVSARVRALQRRRDRESLMGLSLISVCLFAALLEAVGRFSGTGHGLMSGELTGSSLLADSVGGYVLVAVIAFIAAVVITTICFRIKQKNERERQTYNTGDNKEEKR